LVLMLFVALFFPVMFLIAFWRMGTALFGIGHVLARTSGSTSPAWLPAPAHTITSAPKEAIASPQPAAKKQEPIPWWAIFLLIVCSGVVILMVTLAVARV